MRNAKEFTFCELLKLKSYLWDEGSFDQEGDNRKLCCEKSGKSFAFCRMAAKLKYAEWEKPTDMRATFGAAALLGKSSSRVVFAIGGNNYRMICKYGFGDKQVHLFICWIGTHAEYDELCNDDEQYTVSDY